MIHTIQIKRGTRAQIEAAKAAGQLKDGEPYLITDENRIAVGVSSSGYSSFAKDGANSDITSLSGITGSISTVDSILFDTTSGELPAVGKVVWNNDKGTFEFSLLGGSLNLPVGQTDAVLVKNADNAGLIKGLAVYTVGSDGSNKTVRYSSASSEATSSKTFGVMGQTSSGGNKAFCVTQGFIENTNTAHLVEGAAVWLSPAGGGVLTSVKPSAPNHLVYMGVCIRSHAVNGILYVKIQNGYELEELHNVKIITPTDKQVLAYNQTSGLWENQDQMDEKVAVTSDGTPGYLWGQNGTDGVLRTNNTLKVEKDINNSFIQLAVGDVDLGTF